MTFLLPIGLLALLVLPIVALLHLIKQRRDRVRVPSLQIWRDLQQQNVQQKPRRLPLTLLLLLHLLLAALLAVALGQPLLQAIRGQAQHTVLVIDTSTSMAATDTAPSRLAAAKDEAERIINNLRRGDSVALIELSARPRIVAQGTGADTAQLLVQLRGLEAGGSDGDLPAALNVAQATAQPKALMRTVVLTDSSLRAPKSIVIAGSMEWRVFGSAGDNVAIVALAARPLRDGRQQLYARVANLGTVPIARTLQLELDGERAATEPMRLAPGGEAEWSWPLPAGTKQAEAILNGSELQPLDDRAAVVLGDSAQLQVLLVAASDTPVERALRAQRGFVVRRITPMEYQTQTAADLVVFVGSIPAQLPSAPVLLVAPPREQDLLEVQDEVRDLSPALAADDRFAAVDWKPVTFKSVFRITPPAWANVAVTSGDVPLVLTGQLNNHPIVVWAFDPGASNLPNRLAFPLLTAATARQLLPQAHDRLLLGASAPFALRDPDGRAIAAGTRLTRVGMYRAESGAGAVAVSAVDLQESDLGQRPAPTITEIPQHVVADDSPVGHELWQPLVAAALLVLIGEWLYTHRASFRRSSGRRQRAQV